MNKASAPCDLHIHSNYSDGDLTPAEIVSRAANAGLAAVSITDHDTISGQAEALEAGRSSSVEVVTGIEFTVMEDDSEVHILGYFFDPDEAGIIESTRSRERSRRDRAERMIERLSGLGIVISMDEVDEAAGNGTIGRLHIARILREKGHTHSIQDAFNRYIGKGAPAFVPRKVLAINEAVAIIRGAGGAAVWAHPGQAIRRNALVEKIVGSGISGLESNHPNHTPELTRLIDSKAARYGLLCTGGSDFHFTEVMKADIGGVTVPYQTVLSLKEKTEDI